MMTLREMLSRVQTDIGDIAFEKIQPAEYLDAAKDVADKIAAFCRIWVTDITVTPLVTPTWTYALDTDRTAQALVLGDAGKYAYVTETAAWWKVNATGTGWTSVDPHVAIFPATPEIHQFVMVRRGGEQAREYSYQAVANAYEDTQGKLAFAVNNFPFGENEFATFKRPDGTLDTLWATAFVPEETVTATVITRHSHTLSKWDDTTVFPDFMQETMYTGILSKMIKRLFLKGDDAQMARWQITEKEHSVALYDLKAYTTKFLDRRSWMIPQPINWLPE